jgi:glucokinase
MTLRLLADIGGTNARFALQAPGAGFADIEVLPCCEHATVGAAMDDYLARAAHRGIETASVRAAALAIANPVEGDAVAMTNHHWRFSIEALRRERGLDTLLVVNDFAALAMALPHLGDAGRVAVGDGAYAAVPDRPIGLVGPGTGLGVAGIARCGGRWMALPGEGGHASFAPVTRQEIRILEALWDELGQQEGHVSAERLLSGAGLEAIHRALNGPPGGARLTAPDITARALDGSCDACRATVDAFCAILGSVAGNVALTLGATGGMYIGGGIVPRLGPLFHASDFRRRFEDKGRLRGYLARIPTWVVTEPYPALRGVAAMLDEHAAAVS